MDFKGTEVQFDLKQLDMSAVIKLKNERLSFLNKIIEFKTLARMTSLPPSAFELDVCVSSKALHASNSSPCFKSIVKFSGIIHVFVLERISVTFNDISDSGFCEILLVYD